MGEYQSCHHRRNASGTAHVRWVADLLTWKLAPNL